MGYALMVFSSSTTASRLKRLAFRSRLRGVDLIQTPKAISENGCTYSIRCPVRELAALRALADEYGLRYGKIFREMSDEFGRKGYEPY